jgi:hypothetical protein
MSSVVKNIIVREAGREVRVSSHRLRVGGAVLAVKGGWSRADNWALRGWKSDVVLRYLRDVRVAETGVSNSMGFGFLDVPYILGWEFV